MSSLFDCSCADDGGRVHCCPTEDWIDYQQQRQHCHRQCRCTPPVITWQTWPGFQMAQACVRLLFTALGDVATQVLYTYMHTFDIVDKTIHKVCGNPPYGSCVNSMVQQCTGHVVSFLATRTTSTCIGSSKFVEMNMSTAHPSSLKDCKSFTVGPIFYSIQPHAESSCHTRGAHSPSICIW